MLKALPLALLMLIAVLPAHAAPQWTVLEDSELRFIAHQEGQPVEGRFERFDASVAFAEDQLESSRIEVTIDTASATMGQSQRDQAIHSSSLLAVEQYPTASFMSEQITPAGDGYEAEGALTIRDTRRQVVLPFTLEVSQDPEDASRLRASASGEVTIERLDYEVGQGDFASTSTIANEVVIQIDIEAVRPR